MSRLRGRRRWIAAAAVVLVLAAVAGAHGLELDRLPDVASVMDSGLPNDTLVFDRTGTVLLADLKAGEVQHTDVSLAAMGRWLPAATVAMDDPGFWQEPGVDPGRLLRAAWDGVRAQRDGETGSSIVLRLIRLRLGNDGSPPTRARAVALAVRVATTVPRARILESYLNSLPYGSRAVGVEAAAIAYFQVAASQLDLAQASLLAGLPAAPDALNPLRDLPRAKARQREVLDAMVRARSVSRQQADQAYAEQLRLVGPATLNVAPVFVTQVVNDLTRRYGKEALTRRGFTVLSTLDWGLQQQAERALQQAIDAHRGRQATGAALAAIDPRTGEILSLAGGDASTPGGQYHFAIWPPRNPGNAARLFTYAAAISGRRYTMVTPVEDAPVTIDMAADATPYTPQNFDRRLHGTCELWSCLGAGLNIPAVRVELGAGVPEVVETARALGAPPYQNHPGPGGSALYSATDPPTSFGPSLTLGGYGQTPLQLATAAGTLANGGVRLQPEALRRVAAADGGVIYQALPDAGARQAFDRGAAFVVSQMLAQGVDPALALPGRHTAALTGTSEVFSDVWAVGYTPSLAAAVWLGSPDYRPLAPGSTGTIVAAPAWRQFMQAALDQLHGGDEWYAPPPGVETATVNGRPAWFLPGTSAATPAPPLPGNVHPA